MRRKQTKKRTIKLSIMIDFNGLLILFKQLGLLKKLLIVIGKIDFFVLVGFFLLCD